MHKFSKKRIKGFHFHDQAGLFTEKIIFFFVIRKDPHRKNSEDEDQAFVPPGAG